MQDVHLRKPLIQNGNSYAIRITRQEAEALGLKQGDLVDVEVHAAPRGLRLDRLRCFQDGKGAVDHDQEIGESHDAGR